LLPPALLLDQAQARLALQRRDRSDARRLAAGDKDSHDRERAMDVDQLRIDGEEHPSRPVIQSAPVPAVVRDGPPIAKASLGQADADLVRAEDGELGRHGLAGVASPGDDPKTRGGDELQAVDSEATLFCSRYREDGGRVDD